jgi:hypothetical protein
MDFVYQHCINKLWFVYFYPIINIWSEVAVSENSTPPSQFIQYNGRFLESNDNQHNSRKPIFGAIWLHQKGKQKRSLKYVIEKRKFVYTVLINKFHKYQQNRNCNFTPDIDYGIKINKSLLLSLFCFIWKTSVYKTLLFQSHICIVYSLRLL